MKPSLGLLFISLISLFLFVSFTLSQSCEDGCPQTSDCEKIQNSQYIVNGKIKKSSKDSEFFNYVLRVKDTYKGKIKKSKIQVFSPRDDTCLDKLSKGNYVLSLYEKDNEFYIDECGFNQEKKIVTKDQWEMIKSSDGLNCDETDLQSCISSEECEKTHFCFGISKCPSESSPGVCREIPQEITENCPGVCGCDGNTYCTQGHAAQERVSVSHLGLCCISECDECPEGTRIDPTNCDCLCIPEEPYCEWNGEEMDEGETWNMDTCTSCVCTNGRVSCNRIENCVDCSLVKCAFPTCENPISVPGQCCLQCPNPNQCTDENGRTFRDGASWNPTPCEFCSCRKGEIQCAVIDCAAPPCDNYVVPEGKCCPICPVDCSNVDCAALECRQQINDPEMCCPRCPYTCKLPSGREVPHGTQWNNTPCESCLCNDGNIRCSTVGCPEPPCDNPVRVQEQCCPVCEDACNCDRYCTTKPAVEPDHPCASCPCNHCPDFDPSIHCSENCPSGYKPDEEGCLTCECNVECDCETFCSTDPALRQEPSDNDLCNHCPCQQCITESGEVKESGEMWRISQCEHCVCDRGNINCYPPSCPPPDCEDYFTPEGGCCPVCPSCDCEKFCSDPSTSRSRQSNSGCDVCNCSPCKSLSDLGCENRCEYGYQEDENGCLTCDCINCEEIDCPKCDNPIYVQGTCCPLCEKECKTECEMACEYGFKTNNRGCEICECLECSKVECPKLRCSESEAIKVSGKCCLECPVVCTAALCPKPQCDDWVLYPNTCCPVCPQTPPVCRDGDVLPNNCGDCVCNNGQWRCPQVTCPVCEIPIYIEGECCPRCHEQCDTMCKKYCSDGFVIDERGCEICECLDCSAVDCPDLVDCVNGVTKVPGSCCSECKVDCSAVSCARPPCNSYYTPENECCPVCFDDCNCEKYCSMENYERQATSSNHQCGYCNCESRCKPLSDLECEIPCEFGHIHDANGCITCECLNQCDLVRCASCENPRWVEGQCCPICDPVCPPMICEIECENGNVFDEKGCPTCECLDCENVECPPLDDCDDSEAVPVRGTCCPQCNSPCSTILCPPPPCDNWILPPNECCPICEDGEGTCNCDLYCQNQRDNRQAPPPSDEVPIEDCTNCRCPPPDCTRLECHTWMKCQYGFKVDSNRCPTCECAQCREGDSWDIECKQSCTCINGSEECRDVVFDCPTCENPQYIDRQCCPVCNE